MISSRRNLRAVSSRTRTDTPRVIHPSAAGQSNDSDSPRRGLTHVWRRRAEPSYPEESLDVIDPKANPESDAIRGATYSKLMKAVRTLPVPYRQVITMALEDLPQSEIAAILGIRENNVALRLNRARKMLREKMGGRL